MKKLSSFGWHDPFQSKIAVLIVRRAKKPENPRRSSFFATISFCGTLPASLSPQACHYPHFSSQNSEGI
jgi:hypothetical protein